MTDALSRVAHASRRARRHETGEERIPSIWRATVDVVRGDQVYVRVPRLTGDSHLGPLPWAGARPDEGDRVVLAAVAGRRDDLIIINPNSAGDSTIESMEARLNTLTDRVVALEAASGEWGQLADRVDTQEEVLWLVEDIVEDNLLGTVRWHEVAQLPATSTGARDLRIDLPGGEYATDHVRVSFHVLTEDVRGLTRFTTSSIPDGVPFTAVPLAEGDTHRHLVQVDYPASPGERQLRLLFGVSGDTISGRVGYTRPVFGSPREVSA